MLDSGILTLDIESNSIRAVMTSGRRVLKWASAPVEPGAVQDGVITRADEVGRSLGAVLGSLRVSSHKVAVSITGVRSVYRFLTMPKMPSALMEKAVLHDVEAAIHMPVDELYLSWRPVAVRKTDQDIFVLGVPRHIVDSHMVLLQDTGFKTIVLDCKPLALARAVGRRNVIIADMEADSLHMVLVQEGIPRIMRSIPIGPGTDNDRIARLREEFDNTVRLYDNTYEDTRLDATTEVTLTGKMAPSGDALKAVADTLKYPVRQLEAQFKLPDDMPVTEYAVNLGLAIKMSGGNVAGVPDMDLLAQTHTPRPRRVKELVFAPVIVIGIAVGVTLFMNYDAARAASLKSEAELEALGRQMTTRQSEVKKTTDTEALLAQNEGSLLALQKDRIMLLPPNNRYYPLAKAAGVDAVAGDVVINSIRQEGEKMVITGVAYDQRSVLAYAERLRKTGGFLRVDVLDALSTVAAEKVVYNFIVDDKPAPRLSGDTIVQFTVAGTRGDR